MLGRNFKRINDKNANIVVTSDAEIFIDRFINKHLVKNISARIITGNSKVMKEIVISKLNFYNIKFTIGNVWESTSKSFIDFLIE